MSKEEGWGDTQKYYKHIRRATSDSTSHSAHSLHRTLILFVFLYVYELDHFPYVSLSGEEMLHQSRFRSSNTKHSVIRHFLFLLLHKASSNNVPIKTSLTYDSPKVYTHAHTFPQTGSFEFFFSTFPSYFSCAHRTLQAFVWFLLDLILLQVECRLCLR
jgi:hypothetical protein